MSDEIKPITPPPPPRETPEALQNAFRELALRASSAPGYIAGTTSYITQDLRNLHEQREALGGYIATQIGGTPDEIASKAAAITAAIAQVTGPIDAAGWGEVDIASVGTGPKWMDDPSRYEELMPLTHIESRLLKAFQDRDLVDVLERLAVPSDPGIAAEIQRHKTSSAQDAAPPASAVAPRAAERLPSPAPKPNTHHPALVALCTGNWGRHQHLDALIADIDGTDIMTGGLSYASAVEEGLNVIEALGAHEKTDPKKVEAAMKAAFEAAGQGDIFQQIANPRVAARG